MSKAALICMVEIPMGSRNKYEFDPDLGAIKFDRFVSASVVYPTDYGFIPETLALDGDELDVLVCVPVHDPRWNVYRGLEDLPRQLREEIFHFFTVYKDLDPDRHSEPQGWEGRDSALREIADAQERYRSQTPA